MHVTQKTTREVYSKWTGLLKNAETDWTVIVALVNPTRTLTTHNDTQKDQEKLYNEIADQLNE